MNRILTLDKITPNTWYHSSQALPEYGLEVLISWEEGQFDTDHLNRDEWSGYELPPDYSLFWMLPSLPNPSMYKLYK